jgi:glutaredoxin
MSDITVYSTSWCCDCRRAKSFLRDRGISYREINIDDDAAAEAIVLQINNGKHICRGVSDAPATATPVRHISPTPRVITPATCRSGVKITKSASLPIAKIPFFPASPRRRAGKIVAMRKASTNGTPTSTM